MSKTTSSVIYLRLIILAVLALLPTLGKREKSDFPASSASRRDVGVEPLGKMRSAGFSCVRRSADEPVWRVIPGGTNWLGSRMGAEPPRRWGTGGFRLTETEITVGQYLAYLRSGAVAGFASPQFEQVGGEWRARVGQSMPVTHVTPGQAEVYAQWLGGRMGAEVRLPTEDEWEYAARAGVDGAPYPWGWEAPAGRALFAAAGPVEVGRYEANRWDLRDMAGNVAEYCAGGVVRGGSWADRSPQPLRVFHRITLSPDYRDADIGFRLIKN
jgi:formylglycine-generating enzyme required for sulfatase activity